MIEEEDVALILMMHKNKKLKHGGSVYVREVIQRDRQEAHSRLMRLYFGLSPTYPERYFCHRFRTSSNLFHHIANCVKQHDRHFEQRRNCADNFGHSTIQKVRTTLRMMAYGVPVDFIDENLAIREHFIFY